MASRKMVCVFTALVLVAVLGLGALVQAQEVKMPSAKLPVLITSAGQSPDDNMIRVLANRLGIEIVHDPLISADKIGDVKTVLIAVGGSAKGLGAAGIDIYEEEQRIKKILDKMDKLKAKNPGEYLVVSIHIGGEGRRGDISQRSIDAAAPRSDLLVVWKEGNQDGMFTEMAKKHSIPLISLDVVRDLQDVLKELFAEALAN